MPKEEISAPLALDERWYDEFEKIGIFAAFEYLKPDEAGEEEQKEKFLTGDIENPTFNYSSINIEDLQERETKLLKLKETILKEEPNEVIRQAYRWKINTKIAEIRMLIYAKQASLPETPANIKKQLLRRFSLSSHFIHGQADREVFAYSIDRLKKVGEDLSSSENGEIAEAAKDFLASLPQHSIEYEVPAEPSADLIGKVEKKTLDEIKQLIDLPPRTEKYTAEEIKLIFESILVELRAKDWTAVIENQPIFSVSQENLKVKIPGKARPLYIRLLAIIGHEIVTHVKGRLNGERSKLKLLGPGLDRYDQGEEGVSTMREQAIQKNFDRNPWLERHLAIGMAEGLDSKPRDFREVFTTMQKYHYMLALKGGEDLIKAKETANKKAWDRCVRTFRGTDCKTKGICYTKDIIYAQGNIAVWDVIGKNPDELLRLSIGKYDPSNERHLWIMDQLGITEKDLEDLQK